MAMNVMRIGHVRVPIAQSFVTVRVVVCNLRCRITYTGATSVVMPVCVLAFVLVLVLEFFVHVHVHLLVAM